MERESLLLIFALLLGGVAVQWFAPAARSEAAEADAPATVTVRSQPVTTHYYAYARVEPIAGSPVRAAEAGILGKLAVVPGARVEAGQALGELGGPEIEALLTRREGAVRDANAQLAAAKRTLAGERERLTAQLSTQRTVAQAESAVTAAHSALEDARAQLRAARKMRTLRAPSAGIVIEVDATDGQRVTAGQTILTLQANDRLWLKATYYGADAKAIHVGMAGQFSPTSGGAPIPVRVVTVFGSLASDGGESVGLLRKGASGAGTPAPWLNGEFGPVTLNGPTHSMVGVPTRALILDDAQWWVLVHTPQGDRRRAVVPGPTRGWQTFLEQGLRAGQEVVVQNAFLEYHEGISGRYQPPD